MERGHGPCDHSEMTYPVCTCDPKNVDPPLWVQAFLGAVAASEPMISTAEKKTGSSSDSVLAALEPGLPGRGYAVESGKKAAGKIRRPVLFGENGRPEVSYEIDACHDGEGIVVEVEAGRGARGNASYRDLVRTSLILDARFFVLLLPNAYRHNSGGREVAVQAYRET